MEHPSHHAFPGRVKYRYHDRKWCRSTSNARQAACRQFPMGLFSKVQWKALTVWLSMTSNIAVILALFLLDIRDLYYKVAWIGPTESFSFRTGTKSVLNLTPLIVTNNLHLHLLDQSHTMDSGWASFLYRCEQLNAIGGDGSTFFLTALGSNCSLGNASIPVTNQLIVTADQRVDALTWASCVLLASERRPGVCHEPIVAQFHRRYRFRETELSSSFPPAAAGSDAEQELLRFLQMVAGSYPLHRVICVEAFEVDASVMGSSFHTPTVFGCGSANMFRSEFVGVANPRIVRLLTDKAWLTADIISLMGTEYLIRQNCFAKYEVSHEADGRLAVRSHTTVNFSSFGPLYALIIMIDVALLVLNCRSSLELVKWMSFPTYRDVKAWVEQKESAVRARRQVKRKNSGILVRIPSWLQLGKQVMARDAETKVTQLTGGPARQGPRLGRIRIRRRLLATMEAMGGATSIGDEQLSSFFSRSLYRNSRIVMISLVTQLLSWLLVLPNAVIWTWSDSTDAKLHAYMSSIRCWVLVLLLCNFVWGGIVVRISERAAYAATKRTFLTTIDLILVAAGVSFLHRHRIFAMSERKWQLERQRVNDITSFSGGFLAHGNTFHAALDTVDTTPIEIFYVLYGPLGEIVLTSLGVVSVVLVIKAVYFSQQRVWRQRVARGVLNVARRLSNSSTSLSKIVAMGVGSERRRDDDDSSDESEQDKAMAMALDAPYTRLPLEEWLDKPIRATSLVRNGLFMETLRDGKRLIRPSCYLDFGLIVKRGVIHSRIGFSEIWKGKMTVQEYMTRVEQSAPNPQALATSISPDHSHVSLHSASSMRQIPTVARVSSTGAHIQRKKSLHVSLS